MCHLIVRKEGINEQVGDRMDNKEKILTEIMKVQSQMNKLERNQKIVVKKKLSKRKIDRKSTRLNSSH